jgi:GNAT superfamily N-acetyltransferase
MSSFEPIVCEAKTDEEILDCFETFTEDLIPHLINSGKNDYLSQVRRQQTNHNYSLMFVKDRNHKVVSILGFRVQEFLWSGKTLVIDNFATKKSARGQGFGDIMMKWAINYAKEISCVEISLFSTYMRTDAHRFYLNHGFLLESHHFVHKLND